MAVVSDLPSIERCKKHGYYFVIHDNCPLGLKFNFGVRSCKELPFDYMLHVGDDDFLSPLAWDHYKEYIEKGEDYFGFREVYFYSPESRRAVRFRYPEKSGKVIGAGRMMSRNAIVKADWKLWDNHINNCMDGSSDKHLAVHGITSKQIVSADPCIVDVKTGVNIWDFAHIEKLSWKVESEEALNVLHKEDKISLLKFQI